MALAGVSRVADVKAVALGMQRNTFGLSKL